MRQLRHPQPLPWHLSWCRYGSCWQEELQVQDFKKLHLGKKEGSVGCMWQCGCMRWQDVPHFSRAFSSGSCHCVHPPVVSVLADLPETLPEMSQRLGDSSDSSDRSRGSGMLWQSQIIRHCKIHETCRMICNVDLICDM